MQAWPNSSGVLLTSKYRRCATSFHPVGDSTRQTVLHASALLTLAAHRIAQRGDMSWSSHSCRGAMKRSTAGTPDGKGSARKPTIASLQGCGDGDGRGCPSRNRCRRRQAIRAERQPHRRLRLAARTARCASMAGPSRCSVTLSARLPIPDRSTTPPPRLHRAAPEPRCRCPISPPCRPRCLLPRNTCVGVTFVTFRARTPCPLASFHGILSP